MTTTFSTPGIYHEKKIFITIILTGLLVGVLDITAALIKFYIDTGRGPAPVLKFIARGVFSKEQVAAGGSGMVIWGIVFHFLIALIFTAFLFLIYPSVIKWIKSTIITGVVFGLFVWLIMNRVVVPLSNIPAKAGFDFKDAAIQALILIFMIGIPIALIAHKYYTSRKMQP